MQPAALYLRSSKDRHEVSLEAQRRELLGLAQAKQLTVVEEFADAVESGKDENRPGFQALLKRIKDRDRSWLVLLVMDTSRIARNQYLAHAVQFECDKRGIRILYSKLPETNTITDVVVRAMFQAFDQLHSMMSREKGLAGMAENVRQGFRAGGRAPLGYQLEHIPTGAVRDGAPVTKSRLVPSPDSEAVAKYLNARANGASRTMAIAQSHITGTPATLNGLEWNALTYAGHTVWNVHAEQLSGGGYKGGMKRRPRAEWMIQYDTHQRLISTEEAERILAELEAGRRSQYRTTGEYLLSGLLRTPEGKAWHSDGDGAYRVGKGRRVSRTKLEKGVIDRVMQDLTSKHFVAALTKEARRISAPMPDTELAIMHAEVKTLTATINRFTDLAGQCETPRPFLERVAEAEKRRAKTLEVIEERTAEASAIEALRSITEHDIEQLLAGLASHLAEADREGIKDLLTSVAEKIVLDPVDHTCRIHYRIPTGDFVASPRRSDQFPRIRLTTTAAA